MWDQRRQRWAVDESGQRIPAETPIMVDVQESQIAAVRWAADRMWEGIVGGEDAPWIAGLDVLAATPLDKVLVVFEHQILFWIVPPVHAAGADSTPVLLIAA